MVRLWNAAGEGSQTPESWRLQLGGQEKGTEGKNVRQHHSGWRREDLRGQDRRETYHFRASIVGPDLSCDKNGQEETRRRDSAGSGKESAAGSDRQDAVMGPREKGCLRAGPTCHQKGEP